MVFLYCNREFNAIFREIPVGQFIDTMAHYDFEKWIPMEFVNEEDEDFEFDVNVFNEEILANIRETLRLKIGQYGGEDE